MTGFVNPKPPLLPRGFVDTGEGFGGLRGLRGDPFGVTDVLGLVSNYFTAKDQEKIQQKQIGVEQAALKQQKLVNAQSFAVAQAQEFTSEADKKRQDQIMGLWAVGGAAVVISGLFIYGAVRS